MDQYYQPRYEPSAPPRHAKTFTELERELSRKEELLNTRERELDRREADLREREERLKSRPTGSTTTRSTRGRDPNFPIFVPIIYHGTPVSYNSIPAHSATDIRQDIFEKRPRWTVRIAFLTWFFIPLCLLWNLVCMTATLVTLGDQYIPDVVLASVYFCTLPLFTFTVYRFLYHAARKQRASLYMIYLFWIIVEICIAAFFAIGLRGSGAAGFLTILKLFDEDHLVVGIFCIVMMVLWILLAVIHFGIMLFAMLNVRALVRYQEETPAEPTVTYTVE